MKAKTFENLIRKVVREEIDYSLRREIKSLKEDLRDELKPTIVEHKEKIVQVPVTTKNSLREKIMGNKPIKQRPKSNFTQNSALNDLLNDFSLEKEKNNLAGDLSHGKKQWLDIALSTISKPDLVFLDEPTAGLSVDETRLTGEIVKNLNKQGITFVVVGHDMDFVKQTASKVSLLHLGKMFIEGSVNQVLSDKGVNDIYLGLS